MSDRSGISYVDATWNPIKGCSRISGGCDHCYAESMAVRFGNRPGGKRADGQAGARTAGHFEGLTYDGRWKGKAKLYEAALEDPVRWSRPRVILVCSMGDLFHESVPDKWIAQVVESIRRSNAKQRLRRKDPHTFLLLTKRPERMKDVVERMRFDGIANDGKGHMWMADSVADKGYRILGGRGCTGLRNVWLGVSVEGDKVAGRLDTLISIDTPSPLWVSVEPMLGELDLDPWVPPDQGACHDGHDRETNDPTEPCLQCGMEFDRKYLDWVVVGAETGREARPMDKEWARQLMADCSDAGVPFYLKQIDAKHSDAGDLAVRELPWAATRP